MTLRLAIPFLFPVNTSWTCSSLPTDTASTIKMSFCLGLHRPEEPDDREFNRGLMPVSPWSPTMLTETDPLGAPASRSLPVSTTTTYCRTGISNGIFVNTLTTAAVTQLIHGCFRKKRMFLFNDTLNTFYLWLYGVRHMVRTIQIERDETRWCHMGYSFWLAARVLLYASSHRQDNTYHSFCYTSRGELAGARNSSMGPPWRIDLTTHHTMSERYYHGATSRSWFF